MVDSNDSGGRCAGEPIGGPATAVDDIPKKGADASWPNCPKGMGIPSRKTIGLPMPKKHARFVILGLTNGRGSIPIRASIDRSPGRANAASTSAPTQ